MENSKLITGLYLQERISTPNPNFLAEPYNKIIQAVREGKSAPELLMQEFGVATINETYMLANEMNGLAEKTDWNSVLEHSYTQYQNAELFDGYARKLRRGEDIDNNELRKILDQNGNKSKLKPATEVEAKIVSVMPTGFKPFDLWLGGLASRGSNLFLGYPKSGKTMLACRLAGRMLDQHKDKNCLYLTTEMTEGEIKYRFQSLGEDKNMDRLYIVEYAGDVDGIYYIAEQIENLFIVVDLIDDLPKGEVSEPKMAHVHSTLAQIGRKFGCLMAFGQPTTSGGVGQTIRPQNARWSKTMASAKASMVFSIYNPAKPFAPKGEKDLRPVCRRSDVAWIYNWISRVQIAPMMEGEKDTLEMLHPFTMPIICSSNNWWDGSRGAQKLPLSIAELEKF